MSEIKAPSMEGATALLVFDGTAKAWDHRREIQRYGGRGDRVQGWRIPVVSPSHASRLFVELRGLGLAVVVDQKGEPR